MLSCFLEASGDGNEAHPLSLSLRAKTVLMLHCKEHCSENLLRTGAKIPVPFAQQGKALGSHTRSALPNSIQFRIS